MTDKLKIILAFFSSIMVLVLIGVYSYSSIHNYKAAINAVRHTEEVLAETQHLLTYLQDIETSARGYVISGKDKYLSSYHDANPKIDHTFFTLKRLTKGNQVQQKLLDSLYPYILIKKDISQRIIDTRRFKGFAQAQQLIIGDVGENSMKACRRFINTMSSNENKLEIQLTEEAQENFVSVIFTVILSIILSIAFILTALYFFIRDYKIRVQSEKEVRESELRLKGFLDALPIGVVVADVYGNTSYTNKKTTDILSQPYVAKFNENIEPVLNTFYIAGSSEEYPKDKLPIVRALRGEKDVLAEDVEVLVNNTRVPLRVNASPIFG
ncbi:MAG TPA: CHASE3 domain-containing protein, partial [Cytophagales bacterium]|nr:CHASE3 domain-containing protein [Cytophagales bacterium]